MIWTPPSWRFATAKSPTEKRLPRSFGSRRYSRRVGRLGAPTARRARYARSMMTPTVGWGEAMPKSIRLKVRKLVHQSVRKLISWLPRGQRFKVFRSFADCDPAPSPRLILKIAETREELEACFAVLHDAYVDSGFMKPDPSGMRVTIYHALPTTTTLCAKYDGKVVGTISLIRESELGVPLQKIFDLTPLREKEGNIAEVSALAVHRKFRRTGGSILFPLMKFMYEYCTTFFDTRHMVIAVNPSHIEMYESLLFFRRLTANMVESYDFVNGAPAIGATLDLKEALEIFRKHYSSKPARRDLHAYFTQVKLPNIQFPSRRYFTTNDPVLTPQLLD
ncbi:MAG: GNAT family N-acetyltransferase, partial [Propionivibrio sp.]